MTADRSRAAAKKKTNGPVVDARTIAGVSELFKILGDPTRMHILAALAEKKLCVQAIADEVGVTQSAVSHQLRTLKTMRLVAPKRSGKQIVYSLADKHVDTMLQMAIRHFAERN
ncbi:MAG: ArsR/SmtB family transcription factor [Acidobacteriota bacterium]